MNHTYTALVVREGDWFVINVPGVGVTQARHVREIKYMARDLIATSTDIPSESVNVDVQEIGS